MREIFLFPTVTQEDISVYITTEQPSVNNYPFTLACVLELTEGITGDRTISWIAPNGSTIMSNKRVNLTGPTTDGQLTRLALNFNPLQPSDAGEYSCVATSSSPALATPLTDSDSWNIVLQDSKSVAKERYKNNIIVVNSKESVPCILEYIYWHITYIVH